MEQQGDDPLRDRLGFLAQRLVVVVGDRVRDDGERDSRAGRSPRDPRRSLEAIGHDRDRGNAEPLGCDGVVQTARRAAPSVADRGDDRVGAAHLASISGGAGRLASGLRRRMNSRTP